MKIKKITKKILLALALGVFTFQPATQALPTGLQSDDAKQITADSVMTVIGQNQNNVLNWQSFNIDKGETVNFTNALNYLNIVRGYDMSRIYGTMKGDGNIFLINPNGILFGAGANINVGSLYASTRGIDENMINQFRADGTIGALGLGKSADGNITMALANVKNADSVVLEGNRVVIQDLSQMKDIKKIDAKKVGIGSDSGSLKDKDGTFTTYNNAVEGKLTLRQTESGYLKDGKVDITPADYDVSDYNRASQDYHAVSAYKTIDSDKELWGIKDSSNASHYMLTTDIDLGMPGTHVPIGFANTVSNTYYDQGVTFNGMGHTILNMTVDEPSSTYKSARNTEAYGFFAGNNLKDVSNLNFKGAKVIAKDHDVLNNVYAGVLAGEIYGPTPVIIDNVNVDSTSTVTSGSETAATGGLVGAFGTGYNASPSGAIGGKIKNSSNGANVTGALFVGGIVGYGEMAGAKGETLYNVSNTGKITATHTRNENGYLESNAGGIAGSFDGTIKYATNTGTIKGGYFVGGIVGQTGDSSWSKPDLTIEHAYNTGEIVATDNRYRAGIVGGVVGNNDTMNVTIKDAHNAKAGGIVRAFSQDKAGSGALEDERTYEGVKVNNSSYVGAAGDYLYGIPATIAEVNKNIDTSMGTNLQGLDVSKTGNLDIPDDPRNVITPAEQAKIDKLSDYNETISTEAAAINGIVSKAESAKDDVVSANDSANAAMVALSEAENDPEKFAALAPTAKATAEAAIPKSNTSMSNLHSMADEATTAYNTAKKAYDDAKALNGISDTFKEKLATLEANYNAAKENYDKIVAAEFTAKQVNKEVKIEDYATWIDEMIAAHKDNPPVIDPPVIDPPVIDPPVIDPPVIDPPIIDPPVIDPPIIDPPEISDNIVTTVNNSITAVNADVNKAPLTSAEEATHDAAPTPTSGTSGSTEPEEEEMVTFEG